MNIKSPKIKDNQVQFSDKDTYGGDIVESYIPLVLDKGNYDVTNTMLLGMDYYINRLTIHTIPIMQFVIDGGFEIKIANREYMVKLNGRAMIYNDRTKSYIHDIEYPFKISAGCGYGVTVYHKQAWNLCFILSGQKVRIF